MSEKPENNYSEFDDSVDYGVMRDKLNLNKITFWSVFTIIVVVVMIVGVSSYYSFNKFQALQSAAISSEFREISNLRSTANERLNSSGVLESNEERFHIPIEDAISIYLNEAE